MPRYVGLAQARPLRTKGESVYGCVGAHGQFQIITRRAGYGRGDRSITLEGRGEVGARATAGPSADERRRGVW